MMEFLKDSKTLYVRHSLPAAVGHRALADPGDDVLVDDVAGDPAAGARVLDRAGPGRDGALHIRLTFL